MATVNSPTVPLPNNAPRQLAILVAFNCIVIPTTLWFIVWRKHYSIRAQGVDLIVAQTLFGIISTVSVNLQYALGGPFQCFWVLLGQTWGMNLLIATIAARVIRLKRIYSFHKRAIERYTEFNASSSTGAVVGDDDDAAAAGPRVGDDDAAAGPSEVTLAAASSASRSLSSPRVRFQDAEFGRVSGVEQFLEARYKIERIASLKAWIFLSACFACNTTYTVVVAFVDRRLIGEDFFAAYDFGMREGLPGLTRRGEECSIQYWVFWPTFAVYAFACSLGALRCLYSLRKIRDTHDIRLDLSINLVFSTPCFVYFVVATAVLQKTLAPDVFSWVQPGVATYLIIAVNHVTSVLLPIYRDMTESRNTKKLEINMMSFQKVLDDPALFSRLKAFAARDLCSEQVIFLEELRVLEAKVINFDDESTNSKRISLRPSKSKLSNSSMKVYLPSRRDSNESIGAETSADSVDDGVLKSPTSPTLVSAPLEGLSSRDTTKHLEQRLDKSLRSHFKTVCDVFIRSGSPMEVNLSFLVRQACIEAADAGAYVVGMFDAARDEVVRNLFADTYPKFVSSIRAQTAEADVESKDKPVADPIVVI